jgi:hypothetical protein
MQCKSVVFSLSMWQSSRLIALGWQVKNPLCCVEVLSLWWLSLCLVSYNWWWPTQTETCRNGSLIKIVVLTILMSFIWSTEWLRCHKTAVVLYCMYVCLVIVNGNSIKSHLFCLNSKLLSLLLCPHYTLVPASVTVLCEQSCPYCRPL